MRTSIAHRLPAVFASILCWFAILALFPSALAQEPQAVPATANPAPPQRRLISEVTTSSLVLEKIPPKYPEAALMAHIEGAVVLRIVIDSSGAVQDVKAVSGDPALVDAATQAVRQWKYKPYQTDSGPSEIETFVTINFHLKKAPAAGPPPLGSFQHDTYWNPDLDLYYPISKDWVRETELVRNRYSAEYRAGGAEILLVEVHIPQDNTQLRADTTFTLLAANRSPQNSTDTCPQYLSALASELQSKKMAKEKGGVSQLKVGDRDFYRADFEYRGSGDDYAKICSPARDYLLLWNIKALSWKAVETAVSTLNTITVPPVIPKSEPSPNASAAPPQPDALPRPDRVRVQGGVSTGLLIKKVQPVYPEEARRNRIQGTVRMRAEISKAGDIVDLELIDGPIELAVSAVNAVRLWKYKPYTLNGEPVAVLTEVVVNYFLTP
jgi:TonB family protein